MENINNVNKDWLPFFDENMSELQEIINKIDYTNNSIFPNKQDIFKSLFYFSPLNSSKNLSFRAKISLVTNLTI